MDAYQYAADEKIVLRAQEVKLDGESKIFSHMSGSELVLTNQNIIYPRRGMFGKIKDYRVYPLSSIRIIDGEPQCRLDTSKFMESRLEVSFQDETVSFVFGGLEPKKEVRAWINALSALIVGHEASEENLKATGIGAFTESEAVAETFGGFFGSFEGAFKRMEAKVSPAVACRCPSCNASIKGKRGTTVTCPYCDSNVTIE